MLKCVLMLMVMLMVMLSWVGRGGVRPFFLLEMEMTPEKDGHCIVRIRDQRNRLCRTIASTTGLLSLLHVVEITGDQQ